MIPFDLADIVKFDGKLFRKEQILKCEIDGDVDIVVNDLGKTTEIRRTPKTKILKAETAYLDDLFKVVRAYNPAVDGDGLKCSICGEPQTLNGYFVEPINPERRDSLFIGYLCWKSSLSPKL